LCKKLMIDFSQTKHLCQGRLFGRESRKK